MLPTGDVVAVFDDYKQAAEAIETLSKAEFDVKGLAIIGNDLKSVEKVTGKLSWGKAALAGAASGAWLGLFLGLVLFIFSPSGAGIGFVGAALLIGAGFGMLFGVTSYSITRRKRDFTSTSQVIASNYSLLASPDHVNKARNLLNMQAPSPVVVRQPEPPHDESGA